MLLPHHTSTTTSTSTSQYEFPPEQQHLHNNNLNSVNESLNIDSRTTKRMKLIKCCITGWIIFCLFVILGWLVIVAQFGIMRATPVDDSKNSQDYRRFLYVGSDYTVDKGYPALMVHAVGGILCMLIGIVQFQQFVRRKMIVHRVLGYIYSVYIIIGFVGGVWLIPYSAGGVNTKVAFSLLSLIWVGTLGMALFYVTFAKKNPLLKKLGYSERIQLHREWMIRCFSSICAAITLRIYLFLFSGLFMAGNPTATLNDAQKEAYGPAAWLAVCGNLIVSEIYINMVVRRGNHQQEEKNGSTNGNNEESTMLIGKSQI